MIKEYIEAKYGFKVHTAYIAEVKRDLGLLMYDAPNAVEELKQPRKYPIPEKVEAIKDALRSFDIFSDEKKRMYESIIVFAQIVLFPAEAKFSLGVDRYNIQELSGDENRKNAINDLKMAIPKVKLISKDNGLVEELEKFIQQNDEEQFNVLVTRLRKDLYK